MIRAVMTRFVVQQHDATTLHFDLRLQIGDVLRSWAVPKGPSLDPTVRRLAVPVEDHDLSAGDFEGRHEHAARGSGAVIIWDEGEVEILRDEPDHLSFALQGAKARDEEARPGSDIVAEKSASVRSGKTWQEIAAEDETGGS
jgi:bifunctional non-homologous end joining protein LigD